MGAAGGHVEPLPCRIIGKCPYPNFAWGRHHAQKDNVPFIALKRIGVTTYQPALFNDLRLETFKQLVLNELRLCLALQADHAHGTARVALVGNASYDLSQHCISLRLIQRILTTASAIPIRHVADDNRLQPVGWVGSKRIKRGAVVRITKVVRELDNFWHAAEMLAEHDILSEADFCVSVEAALSRKSIVVWDSIKIVMLKIGNGLVGDPYPIGADLLIIAHHHHLSGDVKQKKTFDAKLAGFVDYNEIIAPGRRVNHLRYEIPRHDPHWDRVATSVHVLPRFLS